MNDLDEAKPLTVQLDGSSSRHTDGKIVRWEWYFGDGSTALGRTVTKTYKQGGIYGKHLLASISLQQLRKHGNAMRSVVTQEFPLGLLVCVVHLCAGAAQDSIIEPPPQRLTITVQPMSQTALSGQPVVFQVNANGSWPFCFQWFMNGRKVPGATNDSLTLDNVTPDDAGTYQVEVTNQAAKMLSRGARLTISVLAREAWVSRHKGPVPYPNGATATIVDQAGNTYATGYSYQTNSGVDFTTLKYNASGRELWRRTYNGVGGDSQDYANAIALDKSGNVYVTGESGPSINGGEDYVTIKYNSDGKEVWVARYSLGQFNKAIAWGLTLDASENVYVWGNVGTVKYGSSGEQVWAEAISDGQVMGAKVDNGGNLYVLRLGYLTTKYTTNGQRLWTANQHAQKHDWSSGLAVDTGGNVYVTGSAGTLKYDSEGNEVWANGDFAGYTILLDSAGQPLISDGALITKLDANGKELWLSPNPGGRLALDRSDNVFFSGAVTISMSANVWVTGKLDALGNLLWSGRFTSPIHDRDQINDLTVDNSGAVCVAGRLADDFTVARYVPNIVAGAPAITAPPGGRVAAPGEEIVLSVSARGDPRLVYQWLFNGAEIPDATNARLIITDFRPVQAGNYSVMVSNLKAWTVSPLARVGLKNNPLQLGAFDLVTQPGQFPWLPGDRKFRFTLYGEAGRRYVIESSTNLVNWIAVKVSSNQIGVIVFEDAAPVLERRFYRASDP